MSETMISSEERAEFIARVLWDHDEMCDTYAEYASDNEFPEPEYLYRWCVISGEFRGEEFIRYVLRPYWSRGIALHDARMEMLDGLEVPLFLIDTEEKRFWQCEVEINLSEGSL